MENNHVPYAFGQNMFQPKVLLETSYLSEFCKVQSINSSDYQNDGDMDLLVAHDCFPFTRLDLFRNDGTGLFNKITILDQSDSIQYLSTSVLQDIDNDGKDEIIIAATYSQGMGDAELLILEETNPGQFTEQMRFTLLDWTQDVFLEDMDLDGLPDLVSREHVNIVVYYQTNSNQFEPAQILAQGSEFYSLEVNHFFNAPFPDLLVGNQAFFLIENQGNRQFNQLSNFGSSLGFNSASANSNGNGNLTSLCWITAFGLISYNHDGIGGINAIDTILQGIDFPSILFEDFDLDGFHDLILVKTQQKNLSIYKGNPNGFDSVAGVITNTGNALVEKAIHTDLDGNGSEDLIWGRDSLWYQLNTTTVSLSDDAPNEISVFPNPVRRHLIIKNDGSGSIECSISNARGILFRKFHVAAMSEQKIEFEQKGFYLLKILNSEEQERITTHKIVVQ
jgi:hypothetical protein